MADMPDSSKNEQAESLSRRLRRNAAYPVFYMFAVTFFFTIILVGVSTATRERVESNRQIMRERALLMAVMPDEVDRSTPPARVHEIYNSRVRPPEDAHDDALYRIVADDDENRVTAYALPLAGQGFWDRIEGFLGLQPDRETIVGIAFHRQNETPGLGAQILTDNFRGQFRGKKLAEGDLPLRLVPASESVDESSVHAVTGATQTSNRLEKIIIDDIKSWRGEEGK